MTHPFPINSNNKSIRFSRCPSSQWEIPMSGRAPWCHRSEELGSLRAQTSQTFVEGSFGMLDVLAVSCGQVHGRQCSAYPACAAVNLTMGNCCPNNNRHWTGNGRNREAARAVSRWVTCKYYFRGHPILQQMKSNRHCLNWGACGQVWDSSLKICGVLLWIFWYWDLFVWRPALHRHCIVS